MKGSLFFFVKSVFCLPRVHWIVNTSILFSSIKHIVLTLSLTCSIVCCSLIVSAEKKSLLPFDVIKISETDSLRKINSHEASLTDELSDQFETRTFAQLDIHTSNILETDALIIPQIKIVDTLEELRQRAHSLRETIEKKQRFRETLDAHTTTDLPIGVGKSGGESLNYSIVIDRVNFTTKGSELMAFMSFVIPDNGNAIAFGGKIPLSKDGGIVGTSRIYLLGDHAVTIGSTLVTLKGSFGNKTFVEVDCNGFKGMSIEAEVEFSRDQIIPENDNGEKIEGKRVKVNFQTYIQDWSELLVKISIPSFQIKGLDGVGFKVDDAYLDWSDLTNPIGLVFPKDYQSPFMSSGNPSLWRGFYIRRAEMRLPNKFKEKQNGTRVKLGVENLIIDDTGFSGQVFAENLISEGDMSGWAYTVDQVKVGFVSNQLQQFQLVGLITVPALQQEGKPARMGYLASRGVDGNYIFAVTIQDRVKLPLWAADVTLYNGSGISVIEKENKFYPTATLNGMLSISALSTGPKAEIAGIRFEQLIISSEAPNFRSGTFGFGEDTNGSKVSQFPLVIKSVGIRSSNTNNLVGLSLNVTINIGDDPSREGFAGTAGLTVWGTMSESNVISIEKGNSNVTNNDWRFDRVELSAIAISINKPNVYDLTGSVQFFENDPTYGDGFKGQLFGKLQKINATAIGLFGKTDAFRYWFADALVNIPGGVVMAPGLAAYAFGGGFYYRMKQSTSSENAVVSTPSGIKYVPDERSIGLKAFVGFGATPTKEAFSGDVALQIAMNQNGGINNVTLVGNAFLLTPSIEITNQVIKEGASQVANKTKQVVDYLSPKSQAYGFVDLNFDNVNDVFHGNIEVYVNAASGLVKGVGENNRAGWATLHFASDEWYVLIGTPAQPIGLEMARLFRTQSYFMMGKNLPESPPPPERVKEMLHLQTIESSRDFSALQSGTGFAFGLNVAVDTGDIRFLMFYGRFDAGAGVDIMLRNYGAGYHCSGTTGPIGINGWFADGQVYAYVEGKVGIKVNLKFYKGDYDILAIRAAALMQVKGPNPFWMKGTVGGDYRILGGLVKGNCRFEVTVGKDCNPVGESNPLQDVGIIAEVSPVNGSTGVDVFNTPQAAFNVPVGEVFNITDIEGNTRIFRVKLSEFVIKDGSTVIPGTIRWNASNDVGIIDSRDILPGKKTLKVVVRVQFEENKGIEWQSVFFDGRAVEELVETSFTTGEAPDFIPPSNVEVSYPLAGQYNFYPREYDKGFIKLRKGQPDLFVSNTQWIQKARASNINDPQNYKEFDFSYDNATTSVNFTIPADLPLNTIQKLELINIPRQNQLIDANVQKITTELISENEGEAQLTTKDIEGKLSQLENKSIYECGFRTSQYDTFSKKIKDFPKNQNAIILFPNPVLSTFLLYLNLNEPMDSNETALPVSDASLVTFEADLNNQWYIRNGALAYDGYPLLGTIKTNRDVAELGLPPVRSVWIDPPSSPFSFTATASTPVTSILHYDIMRVMQDDFRDIQCQLANFISVYGYPEPVSRYKAIIGGNIFLYPQGDYSIWLNYQIPFIKKRTSTEQFNFGFHLK